MRVAIATHADLPTIRATYFDGRARQREQGSTVWPEFSDDAIRREIDAQQLFLVLEGQELAGVFSVAYEDGAIWGARECGRHIYLHRIVRAGAHLGGGIVDVILEWAEDHCRGLGRAGLRMDTWANNGRLIAYYEKRGFHLVGTRHIDVEPRLPAHYHGLEFALLERGVEAVAAQRAGS